jgi:hypothetical protein
VLGCKGDGDMPPLSVVVAFAMEAVAQKAGYRKTKEWP